MRHVLLTRETARAQFGDMRSLEHPPSGVGGRCTTDMALPPSWLLRAGGDSRRPRGNGKYSAADMPALPALDDVVVVLLEEKEVAWPIRELQSALPDCRLAARTRTVD
jgi:hypothetical protein